MFSTRVHCDFHLDMTFCQGHGKCIGKWQQSKIYCKRGYFRWGKFRENVAKTFHVGVIFTLLLLFPS